MASTSETSGRKRPSRRALGCAALLACAAYACSWELSRGVWYQFTSGWEAEILAPASIAGVEVDVWANGVNTAFERSLLCPLIRTAETEGPFVVIVRLDDDDQRAVRARILSAAIEAPGTAARDLTLVRERGATPREWIDFYPNATRLIVHTFDPEPIDLPAKFTLRVEAEIEKDGRSVREVVEIPIRMRERRSRGGGMAT